MTLDPITIGAAILILILVSIGFYMLTRLAIEHAIDSILDKQTRKVERLAAEARHAEEYGKLGSATRHSSGSPDQPW